MKLGDIFKLSSGKSLPEKKRISGECNVYGGNGITGSHNDYFVEEPTIVIGRVGEYCGAVHLTAEKCWVTDNALMVTEWYQEVDKEYMTYALNAMNLHQYAKTVGQPSISQANVYTLDIELPSIEQQREIVKILNVNKNVLVDRQRELELLDDLIKARFVELFRNCNEYERLGEADIFISDGNYSSKYPTADEFVEYGIPFIRASNMVDNTISDDEMYYISADKHSELLKGHVKPFDILIATRGAGIGKIAVVPERHNDSNINAQIVLLRCNTNVYNPLYLSWYMKLQDTQMKIQGLISGSAQPQLPIKRLVQLDLLRPEIEKQNEFSDFVKQVDKSKVVVQKALDEAQLLFDSLMQQYFG